MGGVSRFGKKSDHKQKHCKMNFTKNDAGLLRDHRGNLWYAIPSARPASMRGYMGESKELGWKIASLRTVSKRRGTLREDAAAIVQLIVKMRAFCLCIAEAETKTYNLISKSFFATLRAHALHGKPLAVGSFLRCMKLYRVNYRKVRREMRT